MRCISPLTIRDPSNFGSLLTVPCGKCGMCKANRRTEWSFRILKEFESKSTRSATFVTLTYDQEHLPMKNGTPSLCKRDWQLFMKKLRKRTNGKIRYYTVGEYGTRTNRPHYHSIIFNLGNNPHTHILPSWTDSNKIALGNIYCGTVSHASIHYVTKYHVNYRTKKEWEDLGMVNEPEFAVMSRNPGIGADYLMKNQKWFKQNGNLFVLNNGYKQRMPRYYKDKVFNRVQKDVIGLKAIAEADKRYLEEIRTLEKYGYENPETEYQVRAYFHAKKVQEKANKRDSF